MKETIRKIFRTFDLNVVGTSRLGVDVELDLIRLTATNPIFTIFDVGGNFGQTAVRLATAFPPAKVFTFEPVPASFECLRKAVAGYSQITPFNKALGPSVGKMKMNVTPSAGSNTLLETTAGIEVLEIEIDTVDAVALQHGIARIDLLKIDVEGFELQVLEGAKRMLENSIRFVFAECVFAPDTKAPHTSFFDLHRVLEGYGFCFVSSYAESFRLEDGCALQNVLYAHRADLPPSVPGKARNIW